MGSRFFLLQRFSFLSNSSKCSKRFVTTQSAKSLLGLQVDKKPTIQELRSAYFEMAKRCHPDMHEICGDVDFLELTEAYEYLLHNKQQHQTQDYNHNNCISKEEEEDYRQACLNVLGLPAEIVEESKQNPMFRHWLTGNTDGAQHWRSFFAVHGGLAQKLRPPAGYLEGKVSKSQSRRKKRKR